MKRKVLRRTERAPSIAGIRGLQRRQRCRTEGSVCTYLSIFKRALLSNARTGGLWPLVYKDWARVSVKKWLDLRFPEAFLERLRKSRPVTAAVDDQYLFLSIKLALDGRQQMFVSRHHVRLIE